MNPLGLPDCLELMTDVSSAQSVVDKFSAWDQTGSGLQVASFLPAGYESYVRILHPVQTAKGDVRWSDFFAGTQIGPEQGWMLNGGNEETHADRPSDGNLPRKQLKSLVSVLEKHTSSPKGVSYCFWDGWGFWHPGAYSVLVAREEVTEESDREARSREGIAKMIRTSESTEAGQVRDDISAIPRVAAESRSYFLFRGPLSCTESFEFRENNYQAPTLWWPEDSAWCVATEIDGYSTYLGGTRACTASVAKKLETVEVTLESRIDPGPY